jgi:hypothetical protein
METKVKILDGVVESIDTDNQNDVTLIYTKLNFERFVDKSNKLCRGYKQHLTDLMGSIENTKDELKKWQDRCDNLVNQGKELNPNGMLVGQVREKKYRLSNLLGYHDYVLNLIPKLDNLCSVLQTYTFVDETKKESDRAKVRLSIDKYFAKDIHNNIKNPEVHIATNTNGEYIGLVGYVSY